MNNGIYKVMLEKIQNELNEFTKIVNLDNPLGLEPKAEDILSFLEFTNTDTVLSEQSFCKTIITEGDVLSTLKIIHDLTYYEGNYLLFINDNNKALNTYLIKLANEIYENYNLSLRITIDYSKNYNHYLEEKVTLIGSPTFLELAFKDFPTAHKIPV